MNKKICILLITLILIVLFAFIKSDKFNFNYTSDIYSIQFNFISDSGQLENKVITNKNKIAKVIEFLNSLTLTKDSARPQDAVNHVDFKDSKGDIIYSFQFGKSGILWIGSKTYNFGNSNISTLKRLLALPDN